jgi:hypothetical protein
MEKLTIEGIKAKSDWKFLSVKDVVDKGGKGFLAQFGGSLEKAISVLYPEVQMDSSTRSKSQVHIIHYDN